MTGIIVTRLMQLQVPEESTAERTPAISLGLVYLPVTQAVSDFYSLGVRSGALITQVSSGSLGEQAGIREGDVILTFNGVEVNESTPLLGMMRGCSPEECITMEVWSGNCSREVTIVQPAPQRGNTQ